MRYTVPLLIALALCFAMQSLALRAVGGRTTKSESNFFSSLARIQTGIRDQPKVMLLGSSMTGRFPDRTSGFDAVSNLGCDGGNALDTLRAMDQGILPTAPVMVIEGNTFYRSLDGQVSETSKALHSPWFRIGTRFPPLGASARPTAFAYSKLLAGKIGQAEGPHGPILPVSDMAVVQNHENPLPTNAEVLVREAVAIFDRMRQKNTRLLLVILPPGADENSLNIQIPKALSAQSGVPLLDLTAGLPSDAVHYTDGVHMAPATAAAALRTILSALEKTP